MHRLEHFLALFHGLGTSHALVEHEHFGHLVGDGQIGIERGHGILEDHRHVPATDLVEIARFHADQLLAIELDRPFDLAIARQKPHGGHHRLALARSRFPHDGQCLARFDGKVHLVDRTHCAVRRFERHRKVGDFKHTHDRPFLTGHAGRAHHADRRR